MKKLIRAIAATGAAILVFATAGSAAERPTRSEYVAQLERICKPDSEATQHAVRGIRGDVRSERLAVAARKLDKAEEIFAGTVGTIAAVPRPAEDLKTLGRWFALLHREKFYLQRMVAVLRAADVPGFERVSARFIHEGNRANNAVISFGFVYCSFKPTRFQ